MCMPRTALVALSALVIAGCSNDSDDARSSSGSTSTTAEEPALPAAITADGAESVKLAERLQREVEISDNPDWLVDAFGSLWTIRGNGEVFRIDPANGEVIAQITAGEFETPLCQGIGASGDSIWACPALGEPGGTVVRIDPESNQIVSTLKTRKIPDQGRLVSAADQLWLLTDGGARLTGVDLESEKVTSELRLGETCTDLSVSGTTLWAMCPIDGHVLRIDATVPEVTGEVELDGARNGSINGDLWVGFGSGLAQIDPEAMEVVAVYDVEVAFGGSVFATDEEVWVREPTGHFLTRIDPDEQRIVETIEAPKLTGGDVIVIGDSVWASAVEENVIVQLKR